MSAGDIETQREFCVACARVFVITLLVYLTLLVSACTYDVRFEDCTVTCANGTGCPSELTCGSEGLCRTNGAVAACSRVLGGDGGDASEGSAFPSCAGLAATCGPVGTDDCCSTAVPIPGGTYYRSYDMATDGMFSSMSYPATVSAFLLDRYEVTVGRFRAFMAAGGGTQANPPAAGAGAHAQIANSGWDASWDAELEGDAAELSAALACDPQYATWTAAVGTNESLPINCVTWYEAEAFCAWDGGYLPSEAEWNYAAAGGNEQRAYPWSVPAGSVEIDCTHANYAGCTNAVSSTGNSPAGEGEWGQVDMAGNVLEWTLDFDGTYNNPCDNCSALTAGSGAGKEVRGGSFLYAAPYLRTGARKAIQQDFRGGDIGVRCAR